MFRTSELKSMSIGVREHDSIKSIDRASLVRSFSPTDLESQDLAMHFARQIQRRVSLKKAHRLQHKATVLDGHHGPIFGARYMR